MIPPEFIYLVTNWPFTYQSTYANVEDKVNQMAKEGWYLVTISEGLSYWCRTNPEYIAFLDDENKRKMSRKKR